MNVRFFSERVFGAWVNARVGRVTKTHVTLHAEFHGNRWSERRPVGVPLFDGDGNEFTLQDKTAKEPPCPPSSPR